MAHPATSAAVRLSVFYAALFAVVGLHLPYWPVWLEHQGLGPQAIGLLVAAKFWVKPLANPIVAEIVDRTGRRRATMKILALGTLLAFCLFTLAEGFWQLLGASLVAGMLFSSLFPLGENLALLTAYRHRLDYGRLRLWGSLAFIVTSIGAGGLLTRLSPDFILAGLIAALAILLAVCDLLPRTDRGTEKTVAALPFSVLLRDRRYWLFIAATAMISASHMTYYGFASIHWQKAGIGGDVIGLLWAEGVLVEVALFAFSGRVVTLFGPSRLLLIAAVAAVVRWTLTGSSVDPAVLFPANALHALTFGAAHLGAMHYMTRGFPLSLSARAQGVYSAVVNGVVPGTAVFLAGVLYERLSGGAFFVSTGLALLGALFSLALMRREKTNAPPDFTSDEASE